MMLIFRNYNNRLCGVCSNVAYELHEYIGQFGYCDDSVSFIIDGNKKKKKKKKGHK